MKSGQLCALRNVLEVCLFRLSTNFIKMSYYISCRGGLGFDVKIIRTIIRLRKKAKEERQEEEELIELYKMALGME